MIVKCCGGVKVSLDTTLQVLATKSHYQTVFLFSGICPKCNNRIVELIITDKNENTFNKRIKFEKTINLKDKFSVLRDFRKEQNSFNVKDSKSDWLYSFNNAAIDFNTGRVKYSAKELEAMRVKA